MSTKGISMGRTVPRSGYSWKEYLAIVIGALFILHSLFALYQAVGNYSRLIVTRLKLTVNADPEVFSSLEAMRIKYQADRAYIVLIKGNQAYRANDYSQQVENPYESTGSGVSLENPNIKNLPAVLIKSLFEFDASGMLLIPDIAQIPSEPVRQFLEARGTRSCYLVAIKNNKAEIIGFVGIEFVLGSKVLAFNALYEMKNNTEQITRHLIK